LPFKLLFFNLQTIIEVLVAFTENALLLLLRNILWSTLLIFPFLFKTLGTQFAPPIFLFTKPVSYQQKFNTLTKQKKLQLFATMLL